MFRVSKQRLGITLLLVGFAIAFSFTIPQYFCFALPKSLNHCLFWKLEERSTIRRGDYILYDISDTATGWKKLRMIKLVACDEGDRLTVIGKKFYCNGTYLGQAKDKALNGSPLRSFVWDGPVPTGRILPMGEHKDSYDGRYYGFISKSDVLNKAQPVFD